MIHIFPKLSKLGLGRDAGALCATLHAFGKVGALQLFVDFPEERLVHEEVLGMHDSLVSLVLPAFLCHLLQQVLLIVLINLPDPILEPCLLFLPILVVRLPHLGLNVYIRLIIVFSLPFLFHLRR